VPAGAAATMSLVQLVIRLSQRRWAWRITLALVFLVPILAVLPHARSLVVRNAVITAYLNDVKAPIDGRVDAIRVRPGDVATTDVAALTLQNDLAVRGGLARLDAERVAAAAEVPRLRQALESLRAQSKARHAELDAFVEAVSDDLTSQLKRATDQSQALAVELKAASGNVDRARTLNRGGLLPKADLEIAEATYERAVAAHSSSDLARTRLMRQLDEIQHGVFQIEVPGGIQQTRQLIQDLDLQIVQVERQLRQSEAEASTARAAYGAAEPDFQNEAVADVRIRPGLTVWNVYESDGNWVTKGTVLASSVDCSSLMADIAVDDAALELIEPGQKVRLRLFGTFEYFPATVILVRGSAGLIDTPVLAAEMRTRGARSGRVLARLDDSRLSAVSRQSCGIGRTAYAEFEGISMWELILYPLFR
jgi:multidrug resistance efflux pump